MYCHEIKISSFVTSPTPPFFARIAPSKYLIISFNAFPSAPFIFGATPILTFTNSKYSSIHCLCMDFSAKLLFSSLFRKVSSLSLPALTNCLCILVKVAGVVPMVRHAIFTLLPLSIASRTAYSNTVKPSRLS